MGSSLVWLLLKSNDPHCNVMKENEGKTGAGGKAPRKFLGPLLFNLKKAPFLI